jgi:calmodulin
MLMTMGFRWSEEEADEFMKFCDSKFGDAKSEGKFLYMDVIKKIMKKK